MPNRNDEARTGSIYISGPMSDIVYLNEPFFRRAQAALLECGYSPVIVPHDLTPPRLEGESDSAFYDRCLEIDLARVEACDSFALLPGWAGSRGSRRELKHALDFPSKIVILDDDGWPT